MSDFIHQFPYSDFHEMNLDWIIKEVKRLGEKLDTFIDYNKIKFADPVEWSIARQYEALTLVFDVIWQEVAPGEEIAVRGYNLYMSIEPVPKGINIHNEDYWQLVIPFTIDDDININSRNVVTNKAIATKFNSVDLHIDNANERIDTTNERVDTLSTNLETEIHDRIVDDHELAEAIRGNAANIAENTSDISALTDRVDNLSQTITPGGTTGDAELADIRVAFNGITYSNAGDAVRAQAKDNYDKIFDLEKYCYTKINDNEYNCYSSTQNYFELSAPLIVGRDYEAFITFHDFDTTAFSKITEVATYSAQAGASKRNILLSSSDIKGNITYIVDFTAATADALYVALSTASDFSYADKSVSIVIYDKSVKFASKTTENVVNDIESVLTRTLDFSDIDFTVGTYQLINGTTASNANFMISDFIKVTEGMPLEFTVHSYNNVGMAVLFAADKTTVKRAFYTGTEQTAYTVETTIAEGEEYIRFCRWSNNKSDDDTLSLDVIEDVVSDIDDINEQLAILGESQWNNKEWHCFGTSISNASAEGKYPSYLSALSGLNYHNFAYSGGKITTQILNQIQNDTDIADADLITVEGFVNDWSQQTTLGLITDTTADTFYGALYVAITYILSHSDATLVFITDTTGANYGGIDIRREAMRNGLTQNDFIKATIEMCEYMGVPIIDAGRKSCISQDTADLYLADQIHQTEKGGQQYAQTIWSELKNIKPRIK